MTTEAFFVGGLRTPFARAPNGSYRETRGDDLLTHLIREQIRLRPQAKPLVQDVIVGSAYPEGEQGYNVARCAALGAYLEVPAVTLNRLCGSSLEAVALATSRIRSGFGNCYIAAGVESMSRAPRRGANFTESTEIQNAAPQVYVSMGETAENLYQRYKISRTEQEEFAARSHETAYAAFENKKYAEQIYSFKISRDEGIRYPANRASMAQLKPAFRPDGVVTAATSSPLSDGASSGWVVDQITAKKMAVQDGLRIVDVSWSHIAPEVMGLGPVPAIRTLMARRHLNMSQISAFELNEAFAIQVLACQKDLEIPLDLLNLWGGAIALGHPLGASGLRLLMTLQSRLREVGNGSLGIASLCIGGGQGMAVLCELVEF